MSSRHPLRKLGGLGLIEVMIAMVIGLVLLAGIYRVYLTSARTSVTTESLAARQEAIRYISERIGQDVRMAGYRGCLSDAGEIRNTLNPNPASAGSGRTEFTHSDFRYRYDRYAEGFDATSSGWSPALPSSLTNVVAGTDVLTVRASLAADVFVIQDTATTSSDLRINPLSPAPLAAGNIVMVSDCSGAAIFQTSGYTVASSNNSLGVPVSYGNVIHSAVSSPAPGNWTQDLGRKFSAGAQLIRIGTVSYLIRNSARGSGPALWRVVDDQAQEVAEGVENLQVLYGDDSDGDRVPDVYRPASAFTSSDAWRRVVSVRVALLVAGSNRRAGNNDPHVFDLLGVSVGPFTDGRLRRVVTLTLALRNRLP